MTNISLFLPDASSQCDAKSCGCHVSESCHLNPFLEGGYRKNPRGEVLGKWFSKGGTLMINIRTTWGYVTRSPHLRQTWVGQYSVF